MRIFNFQFSIFNKTNGQAMLLTVLVLGSSILAASTVAGYLTLLKIRSSSDIANSAKAIFSADAGIEWELCKQLSPSRSCSEPAFSNGASFVSSITENADGTHDVKSIGQSGKVFRAFGIGAEGAANILPE